MPSRFALGESEIDDRPITGDILTTQALGEVALARWFAADRSGACRAWLQALNNLLAGRDTDDDRWRSLFVVAGHVSGYLAAMVSSGKPPTQTLDGDPYAEPRQGMLIAPPARAATLYKPDLVAFVGIHAMLIADTIGDREMAVEWAARSTAMFKASGMWMAAAVPLQRLVEHAVIVGDFSIAIDHELDAVAAYWMARGKPAQDVSLFESTTAPRQVIGSRPGADWNEVDSMVVNWAVLPAFLRVAADRNVNAEKATTLAVALRDACLTEAEASSGSAVWQAAVEVCVATLLNPPDAQTLLGQAEEHRARGELFTSLSVMAQIGASLDSRQSHNQLLALHISAGHYVHQLHSHVPVLYESVVVEFFTSFWRKVFDEARFRFRTPALITKQLDELPCATCQKRLPRLFRSIAWGLDVSLPDWAREWIEDAA